MAKVEDAPCVVLHNNMQYLMYKIVDGRAHLMDEHGKKFSGTPAAGLKIIKSRDKFEIREFNQHSYVQTKQGIVSLSTGNRVKMPEILKLFPKAE